MSSSATGFGSWKKGGRVPDASAVTRNIRVVAQGQADATYAGTQKKNPFRMSQAILNGAAYGGEVLSLTNIQQGYVPTLINLTDIATYDPEYMWYVLNGDYTITDSRQLNIPYGVTFRIELGQTLTNNGTINNAGTTLNVGTLTNNDTFKNDGTTLNVGTFTNTGTTLNVGTLTNNNTFNNDGTYNNIGTTVNNDGTTQNVIAFINYGTFNNDGTLTNNSEGENDANFNIHGTLNNDGTIDNTGVLTIMNTGTLNNDGIIDNAGTFTNDGTFNNTPA
jgi:hypothetical protein